MATSDATIDVLGDVAVERARQDAKFPDQQLPNGTRKSRHMVAVADWTREQTDRLAATGDLTWAAVLEEEFKEALAEEDDEELEAELIQVAAVAVRWVEDIRRRRA